MNYLLLKIQIGCHDDQLYHIKVEELKRPPNIALVFPVKEEKFKIASPYGGLIYIKVAYILKCYKDGFILVRGFNINNINAKNYF